MPYNSVGDSIHIKKFCSRLSSSEVYFLTENGYFAFLAPFRGGGCLQATYTVHFRLVEKRLVDFILVIIELFFARCYG